MVVVLTTLQGFATLGELLVIRPMSDDCYPLSSTVY